MDNNLFDNIELFMEYMKKVKNASENTLQSYRRDLTAMAKYFMEQNIEDVSRINGTNINSYVLYMERQGKSTSTISRSISAIKTFFRCMINNGAIKREPTENLQSPENEIKKTETISAADMAKIISCTDDEDCDNSGNIIKKHKAQRDKAMLMLMNDTGIKISEITEIKVSDINLQYAYVTCHGRKKDKTIRFSNETLTVLEKYVSEVRNYFVKQEDTGELFLNCFGRKLSRQGVWKMFKEYADKAGVAGVSTRGMKNR